jgi:hypothetical protein
MHAPSAVTNNGAGHGAAERPRLGAHVSVAGGLLNAPRNAVEATCEAFQIWVSSCGS